MLYNKKKVDIENVIAPPYDVISQDMQAHLYQKDKHNVVRLILGKEEKNDNSKNNRYTRAKKDMESWIKSGVLIRDTKPSMYIYAQTYLHKGKKKTRIGFMAVMKIEDPKKSTVLPHEYTLAKPKKDRLNLIKKTEANLSPIFTLFQDERNVINSMLKKYMKSHSPLFIVCAEGVTHKLWNLDKKSIIGRIESFMRDKKIFIADGHHRYEVSVAYRGIMRKSGSKNRNSDFIMMYFSSLSEKGSMTILSTHRVIKDIPNLGDIAKLPELRKHFTIKKFTSFKKMIDVLDRDPGNSYVFGAYTGGKKFFTLNLKNRRSICKIIDSPKTDSLKKLNVTILHDLILNKILSLKDPENSIKYVRNEADAAELVRRGSYKAAFFLKPTKIEEMRKIAEKGEMMPQKSTYFYPKLLTGLVINKF